MDGAWLCFEHTVRLTHSLSQGLVLRDAVRFSRGTAALQAAIRSSRRASQVAVRLYMCPVRSAEAPLTWADVTSSSHAVKDAGTTLRDFLASVLADTGAEVNAAIIQGVAPPMDAPLDALHAHLSGPDMFLHIVCFARDG